MVINMVVYADILVLLNFLVNYFLILTVKKITYYKTKTYRIIFSAFLGGLSSLYIFLPQMNIFVELLLKILLCAGLSFCAFGFRNFKYYLRAFLWLFLATCLYGGIMIAVWHILKPQGMVINNSVVYFNISPLFLIGFTVAFYLIFSLIAPIFSKTAKSAERCEVTILVNDKKANINAIVDNGNSLTDIFGKSEIIIADKSVYYLLFGSSDTENSQELKARYRAVPCSTVTGSKMLDGYRCDKATLKNSENTVTLEKPIIAISNEKINDGFEAIINPKIFY